MPRPPELGCLFDPIDHVYQDHSGKTHHSVTQILTMKGCHDFSMVDPVTLLAAAERGTAIHQLTHEWDKVRGEISLNEFLLAIPHAHHGYLQQYEAFLVTTGFHALAEETERPRLIEIQGIPVGMTPDRVGYFPNSRRLVILDLKTGVELFSHPLQLAAYSLGLEKSLVMAMAHTRVALYLEPESYKLRYFRHGTDYYAFLDALQGEGHYLASWMQLRQRSLMA